MGEILSHDRGARWSHKQCPWSSPRGSGARSHPGSRLMPNADSGRAAGPSMASDWNGRAPRIFGLSLIVIKILSLTIY